MKGDAAASGRLTYPWEDPPAFGEPREVVPGVEWLRLPLPMALDHVNCWLLTGEDGLTVVDTGLASRKSRELWTKALDGRRVTRVIVTHHHPDHVGLAGWFMEEHGAELFMSRTAYLMARMLTFDVQERPTPEMVAFWRSAGMKADVLEARLDDRPFNFADVVVPLPLGFHRLSEGDMVEAGGRWWQVHLGAGHAPEHVTLWSESDDLILGGDQLLPSISPNIGVHATEPEADPVTEWLDACERLRQRARPEQLVLPGHKRPFRGLPFRMGQLIDNHVNALDRLEAHIDVPRTAAECFPPLFKREVEGDDYGLALLEAMAHCLHLWHAGRATRERREDGAWLFGRITAERPAPHP